MFFLAFIHCIIECTPEESLGAGIPLLFDSIIGGPLAAPMFMFAMLLIAALRWLKVSDALMFIIALGMSLVSMLFNGVDVNSVFGNIVLGLFIGTEDAAGMVYSDFLIMNWIIVPTVVMKCLQDISKNMTYVYCIHWVIIGFVVNVGLYVITGTQELSVPAILLMSFIISVVSILIAHIAAEKMKVRAKKSV